MKIINYQTGEISDTIVKLIGHYGDESLICSSARVSYGTNRVNKRTDEELLTFLLENKHLSPLESCDVHFYLKIPIFVARQLMRHRTAKVNERSLRYSKGNECRYYEEGELLSKERNEINKANFEWYFANVQSPAREEGKLPREQCRGILPVDTITELYYKLDLRNFFGMYEQRGIYSHAQHETREVAYAMWNEIEELFPICCEWFDSKWRMEELVRNINLLAGEKKVK